MVHVKVVVVFTFILLSVVLQLRVESQPTIISFENNSCPQLEEDWRKKANETQLMKLELENKRQRLKALENAFCPQCEEIQRLKLELENKHQRLAILENVSNSQSKENQRLRVELENERQSLKTLKNVSQYQYEDIQRLHVKLQNEQHGLHTLKNAFHSHCDESQRLNVELENETRLIQNSSLRRATVKLIRRISGFDSFSYRVIKVLDEFYVLCYSNDLLHSIKVFENSNKFRFQREIFLNGTIRPYDMVYSNESKFIYILDTANSSIWRLTTEGGHRLTKWMTNLTLPIALSLSIEGYLLVLSRIQPFRRLEIYSLSADLIRTILLPYDVRNPRNVVQTSAGFYVILHELSNTYDGSRVISQVNSAGQLMNRFIPRNQFQVLNFPEKLFYDSDNNRLFVADKDNHRVLLFDSNCLNWVQVLLSQETERISFPLNIFYDATERHILVSLYKSLDIYELI